MGIALSRRLPRIRRSVCAPTRRNPGQTIISGMGELHLEIIVDRMKREFGVGSQRRQAAGGYRETIRKKAVDVEGKVRAPVGRQGPVRPRRLHGRAAGAGQGLRVRRRDQGRRGAARVHPAVEKGVNDTLPNGVLAGYPVVDVKVTLTFGSYHEVDSERKRLQDGRLDGLREACRRAGPVILEPMMAVEVETPEDYTGSVMGDLSSRRGMVQGMDDMPGGGKIIKAEVPLSEMFGYSTTLRSMSQGRATYTMEFKHHSEAPKNVADAIITARK